MAYNIVNRILGLSFCLFFSNTLLADVNVRNMIFSASGVSENDIISASVKSALTLYDAYALSISFTENLPIAGEDVVQAKSKHSESIGAYLPNISLNAEKSNSGSALQSGTTSAYIYGRQPIMTGLNELTGIYQSDKAASVSSNILKLTASQQLLTVAQKFYTVCQLQSTLKNNREIVDLYKKIRAELLRRVAVGKNRRNDVLRIDGQISRLEAQIASISSRLVAARSELALSIGISAPVSFTGGIKLPPPAYKPGELSSFVYRRIEVIIAKENIEIAAINLKTAMGGHLPSVFLEGSYRLYSNGDDPIDKYTVSVAASLPIFQGGIPSEKVSQAESVKRQADLILTRTIRAVEENIISSYDTWKSFIKQSEAYRKALDSAERNYKITLSDYRLSLVTILDVFSVLTELQQARDDYTTAMLALELSRIKLGVAISEFPASGNKLLKNASVAATGNLK